MFRAFSAAKLRKGALFAALALAIPALAQTIEEDYKVYTEHPRLLLKPQRLRLLRKERERQVGRWQQLETLIAGQAQMAEPGFAFGLYYQISGVESVGRKAVQYVAGNPSADIRQVALVYDWCHGLLSEPQKAALEGRLKGALVSAPKEFDFDGARNIVFAAIALGDAAPVESEKSIQALVRHWWRTQTAPQLKSGGRTLRHTDVYSLMELLHVIRDNLNIELREEALPFFRDIAALRLLSYYPATYPAAENDFRVPYYLGTTEPDLREAALTRVAEFALVGYDTNAVENQFLQGWLLHDRFTLRGPFGAPYEFLWANPYQPGLSFHHMPMRFHDARTGRFFVRSSWNEDATWLGYVDGKAQLFEGGKIQDASLSPQSTLTVGETSVMVGSPSMRFDLDPDGSIGWFFLGLKPFGIYDVEIDDEGLAEARADRGGILSLEFTRKQKAGVIITEHAK